MSSIQDSQGQDAFLSHLITILSIYELGLPVSLPAYDGPSNWQTEFILHSLSVLARRIYLAEDVPPVNLNVTNAPSKVGAGEDRSSSSTSSTSFSYSGNENPTSFTTNQTFGTTLGALPIADSMRADGTSDGDRAMSASHQLTVIDCTTSQMTPHADHIVHGKTTINCTTVSPLYIPPIVPPSLLSMATEPTEPPLEELRLLKSQLGDIARVCNAVARGDLSHKITVSVQGIIMVQLKDVVNTMVDNLEQFAREIVHTKVGMQRKFES